MKRTSSGHIFMTDFQKLCCRTRWFNTEDFKFVQSLPENYTIYIFNNNEWYLVWIEFSEGSCLTMGSNEAGC